MNMFEMQAGSKLTANSARRHKMKTSTSVTRWMTAWLSTCTAATGACDVIYVNYLINSNIKK